MMSLTRLKVGNGERDERAFHGHLISVGHQILSCYAGYWRLVSCLYLLQRSPNVQPGAHRRQVRQRPYMLKELASASTGTAA